MPLPAKGGSGRFIWLCLSSYYVNGRKARTFSNEAGQGSAPIAHAAAKTEWPAREGLVASLEPLVDTLIICTLTALMIILTGAWEMDREGVTMTTKAMEIGLGSLGVKGIGQHIVTISLILFAFSTVIAWSYYGSRAVVYLFGEKFIKPYGYLFGLFVFLGSIWGRQPRLAFC